MLQNIIALLGNGNTTKTQTENTTKTQTSTQTKTQKQETTTAPVMPTVKTPEYTLDMLARAATPLLDAGKQDELIALLQRYGVPAMTSLQKDQYGAFATDLRALGAQI